MKIYKNIRGFTLIELIVVIAILAILAAILIPSMLNFVRDANVAKYNANAKSVYAGAQLALTDLHAGNRSYQVLSNGIYTGSSDCIGHPNGAGDDCDLSNYLGDEFKGYFGFMVDTGGYGCTFAVWSDTPVTPAMVQQMSLEDVKDNFKLGIKLGCSPLI